MPRSSRVHYIASTDFSITPNCNGSPNDLALTIARGARIHVYSEGAGIDLQDNTFQSWKLIGHNRRLAEGDKPYTIYARLSKKYKDSNNYIEFAPMGRHGDDWVDKWSSVTPDGFSVLYKDDEGKEVKNISENYWYIRLGEVSLPEDGKRTVDLDLGILGTDEYNIDWILNPDGKPFNVEIRCTVDGSDAGTAPYVQMGKTMNLKAVLKEGWGTSASEKFDHWGIERVTGDGTADAQWSRTASDGAFKTTGTIDIPHTRDASDGFAGAVAAVFKVTAYTVEDDPESETGKKYVPLASGSITVYAETSEHYELVPSVVAVSYDPGSGEFIPKDGVQVRIRRTDENGSVSDITYAQFEAAALSVQHAEADSDAWTALAVGGAADAVVVLTVPTSAFANFKDVNVRLLRTMAAPGAEPVAVEIARKTIAFSRDTQDTEDREWIFLRSTESIVFGTEAHPEPADIPMGQVNPPEAASGTVTDKQQAGWVPNGWWDDEHGVNSTWYYEYASYRDYVHEDGGGHWGDFVPAMLWNHFKDTVTEDEIIGVVSDKFLSKVVDDEAHGVITFLKGIKIGIRKLFGWDENGNIAANDVSVGGNLNVAGTNNKIDQISSHNYSGDSLADTGWNITSSYNGHSKLTIDEIYVRMKAVFESLEVRERTYTGGDQIWSCAGNYVNRTDYMGNDGTTHYVDENGVAYTDPVAEDDEAGQARARQRAQEITESTGVELYETPVAGETYGYSRIQIPWMLNGIALVLGVNNRLVRGLFAHYKSVKITLKRAASRGKGGTGTETDEQIIRKIRRVRCYFLAKDGERSVHNWWRINDLARCQTMNLENINRETYLEETTTKAGNVFWWRKVIDVSYNPVKLDDGKWYHYFDVRFDSKVEESTDPSEHATMATFALEGSDIPAAGDSVVQFGNTINPGRMNLMMMEVNGGDGIDYPSHSDAPCLKAYRGVYCFDPNKCWVGGSPCKMKLSPSSGYEFYGPSIKFVTEYDIVPVPIERPEIYWTNIGRLKDANGKYINQWSFEGDAYNRTEVTPYSDDQKTGRNYAPYVDAQGHVRAGAPVRKCYYYEKVSHNGCYFICSIVDGAHWEAEETFVYGGRTYTIDQWIDDGVYNALPAEEQGKCKRVPNYTIEEPSATSPDWTMTVNSGAEPIAVYKWAQKESMTPQEKPTITAAQWAAWTNGSTPIDGWTKNAVNRPSTDPETWYLFQSQNKLFADGSIDMWSTPTRISGAQGTPGEDAEDTEWIYIRNDSKNNPGDPNSISKGQVSPNGTAAGNETNKQLDDWVPNGWSDNALEIAWNNKYVWASFRTKAKGANVDPSIQWSDFSTPIIWSHWGQNGMDGDGVEYVYIRTKNNVAPIVAYNNNINRSYTKDGETITYLDDEFLPVISNNDSTKTDTTKAWAESNTCTDDPKGISRDWPFEWCLSRRMTAPNAETGKRTWRCYGGEKAGDTETMALWDHYGENAIRLDIDNEMDSVQTDSLGKILSTRVVRTVVRLWDGAAEADISAVDFTASGRISGGPASTVAQFSQAASGKGKQLSWTFPAGNSIPTAYEIIISYVYLNVTHRCTFTITASMGQAVYQLKPSLSSLPCTVNSNNEYNNPPALSLSVVKLDNGSTTEITKLDNNNNGTIEGGEIFIRYSLDSMPARKTDGYAWPRVSSDSSFGTVQATPDKANVYIAMFTKSGTYGTLLDRETIPVVKNGTNGDGIVSVVRTYAISNVATTASDTTEPAHQGSWSAGSPAVTEQYPYLWAKEVVTYKYSAATTKYYCIGSRGANGVDAQDIEWVYIRTKTNVAPVIKDDSTYTDTNGHNYTYDDHLPQVTGNANIENNGNKYQCTDDPKGVDTTWRYEWEIKREKGSSDANGHRAWVPYSGTMTVHNSFVESALIIDIDNDNDEFGTDSEDKVKTEQTRSTTASMFYGTQKQTLTALSAKVYNADTNAEITDATVISKTATLSTGVVSVTFKKDKTLAMSGVYVTITAKCVVNGVEKEMSIRFTLAKVKSGAPGVDPIIYQLDLSQKNLSYGRDASNGLVAKSNSVTVGVKKTEGDTTTFQTLSQSGKTCTWGFDGTYNTYTVSASNPVITVAPGDVGTHKKVSIRLSTGDREEIPIITDGANGADGADGKNAADVNPNILLRTVFDNGIAPVKEKWTADWTHVLVDTATDTVTDGRKSIRISAYGLSTYVDFKQNVYGRLKAGTWYTLSFNSYSTNPWQTFIYSASESYACIDRTEWYIDGVRSTSVPINGRVDWPAAWTGERHTITFKTISSFRTENIEIIFRALAGVQVCICMPKLEVGQAATAYMANEDDLAGADGNDAANVIVSPSSLIVDQDLQSPSNLSNLNEVFQFTVMKGTATQITPSQVIISAIEKDPEHENKNKLTVVGSTGNAGTATLRAIGYYTTTGTDGKQKTNYYDSAYFICTVVYNDSGVTRQVTGVKVKVYANLLGTWAAETTESATKAAGEKITTELGEGGEIRRAYEGAIEASATGLRSEYTEQISRAGDYDENLFGFARGLETGGFIPFVQGYGVVSNFIYNSGKYYGYIKNLGLKGVGGQITVSFMAKAAAAKNFRFTFWTYENDTSEITRSVGTAWAQYTLKFDINIDASNAPSSYTASQKASIAGGQMNVWTTDSVNTRIYIRHLSIQRGTKEDFVEANKDIAYTGKGNLITALTARNEHGATDNPVPVKNFVVEEGVVKSGWQVSVNLNGWSSNELRNYLQQDKSFLLRTGGVYTLSYWAKTDSAADGMVIINHLYDPSIIQNVSYDEALYDAGGATVEEMLAEDGRSFVRLSTTWKQYFVRFYVNLDPTNPNDKLRSLIPLRIGKAQNLKSGSTYRSGTVYIAGIEFQEGYVMAENDFQSLIEQDARRITLSQQTGLKKAGIDIGNGTVNLFGDRVTFSNSDGTINDKVSIDPATGTLNAQDGNFGGVVRASQYYQALQTVYVKNAEIGYIETGKQIVVLQSYGKNISGTPQINTVWLPPASENNNVVIDIYSVRASAVPVEYPNEVQCKILAYGGGYIYDFAFSTAIDTPINLNLRLGQKARMYCNGSRWYLMEGSGLVVEKVSATSEISVANGVSFENNSVKVIDQPTLPPITRTGQVVFCTHCSKVTAQSGQYVQVSQNNSTTEVSGQFYNYIDFGTSHPRIFVSIAGAKYYWKEFFCDI